MTMNHPLLDAHHHSGERHGDLLVYKNGLGWQCIAIGTASQLLTVTSGLPAWAAAPAAGAPTDATYLVTTAHASLSAEVAVGATPGGELGGSWASPTVDTTHSGSSHAGVVSTHEAAADPHTGYALETWNTRKVKTSDETINNNDTLQNDDTIVQAIGANEEWAFDILLDITTTATADFKFSFTLPASASGTLIALYQEDNVTMTAVGTNPIAGAGAVTGTFLLDDAATEGVLHIKGSVLNSTNAGNIQLQWAQSPATVTDTIVRAGSYGIFTRLS